MNLKMRAALLLASGVAMGAVDVPEKREFPLSKKVKPCENFYDYVCSEVVNNFKMPADKSKYVFSFSDSYERLLVKKNKFLADLSKKKKLSDRSLQMKDTFLACMNESERAKEEKMFVAETLSAMKEIDSHKEFSHFLTKMRQDGHFSYIYFDDIANQDDSNYKDLYFMTNLLTLPEKTYYDDEKIVKAMEDLFTTFFEEIGDSKNARQRAKRVVSLEKKFAKVYPLAREFESFSQRGF